MEFTAYQGELMPEGALTLPYVIRVATLWAWHNYRRHKVGHAQNI